MSIYSSVDHQYMAQALRLAERGLYTTDPNPRVGSVIVQGDRVVGEGWHQRAGESHAEVHALQEAGSQAKGATAYVTLEPCSHHGRTPPCAEALIKAGIGRVVVAMKDPNPKVAGQGVAMLQAAGIETAVGLLEAQARRLNPGFISCHENARPYVRCKLAMSLDGRTALASGESKWITSEAARLDVQRLRARSSAIVTGIGTVLADDPRLNVRLDVPIKAPDRVVLDTHLRMPLQARMFTFAETTWIATTTASQDASLRQPLAELGARFIDLPKDAAGHVDLPSLLKQLADLQYNEVLVEAGPVLSGAFLKAGLIDEIVIYMAPHLLGDSGQGLFHLPPFEEMKQRIPLQIEDIRQVGPDIRLIAKRDISQKG